MARLLLPNNVLFTSSILRLWVTTSHNPAASFLTPTSATICFINSSDHLSFNFNSIPVVITHGVSFPFLSSFNYVFTQCSSLLNVLIPNSVPTRYLLQAPPTPSLNTIFILTSNSLRFRRVHGYTPYIFFLYFLSLCSSM